ncbi:hypothetical protein [Salibacterium sp. K-3]
MEKQTMKTRDIAARLQVSPATVLKWSKNYRIPYTENQYGHYCFDEDSMARFLEIKEKHQHTASAAGSNVSTSVMLERLAQAEENVQVLERMIMNKADDIVTFQMVEQRKKIEVLTKRLDKLEKQMHQQEQTSPSRKQDKSTASVTYTEPLQSLFQFE